ncbi:Erythromycin esterase [Gemmatirosa kalamazoonensis]|uniref:Erythromycin esterase n=1 Tax=Gemmatirosa kalamazoonensis TaxID=861299 RepID=W0RAH4_9BACT|nr:erythromycin esterase family protein [Gemmatirosa kalamazoonensis]AHG88109.1 Erythromycin esterase [Gemmatirosa kalamazoonensis]
MNMMRIALAASLVPTLALAQQQPPTNLGFEEAHPAADGHLVPVGWYTGGDGYEVAVDTTERVEGRASLRMRLVQATPTSGGPPRFAVSSRMFPLPLAIGRTLRLTGWIRTDGITDGFAGLWMRVDGVGRTIAFDNMQERGPRGTTPWTRYVVELPVDSGATAVLFGMLHPGNGSAWFDSLSVEVVGPPMPRRVASTPPYAAPPRPAEDLGRLLTDAELAPAPDSVAPAVDSAAAAWVRANAHAVRSLGAREASDLAFLAPLLAGKLVVQLGESGHGVREFDLAKVRLIRHLHEALGYDVIAFESSLFACDRVGRKADSLSAMELMRGCIFGVWHTNEVLPLFEYIKETQRTAHPLVLTGFDVQRSGDGDRERSTFLRRVVATLDTAYARRVYATDSAFYATMPTGNGPAVSPADRDRLVAFYDSLAAWIRARERPLAKSFRDDPIAPALARQTAISMSFFARELAAGVATEGTVVRDRGMADNLDFVLDELHPRKKVIVWAHNFHIQHRGFAPRAAPSVPVRTMGTYVAERHRKELYTVGLYMYRGSGAMNNRQVYPIAPATAGTLEAIVHQAPWRYTFVDLSRATEGPGTAWMFRPLLAREWGTNTLSIVPRDEYDGILLVDTTWPPDYVPYAR